MLDIRFVRDNPDIVQEALKNRGVALGLNEFMALEKNRRELLGEVETLKNNAIPSPQEISRLKRPGCGR